MFIEAKLSSLKFEEDQQNKDRLPSSKCLNPFLEEEEHNLPPKWAG